MGLGTEYLCRPNNMENIWEIYMRNIYVGLNNVWDHLGIL